MELCKYNTKSIIDRIANMSDDVRAALPRGEIKVLGEVIGVRRAREFTELTLLDPSHGAFSITARMPPHASVPPEGHIAGVIGALDVEIDGTEITVFVRGRAHDGTGPKGKLYRQRKECYERLSSELDGHRVSSLTQVRKVGLVTGPSSRAEMDLHAGLNPKPRPGKGAIPAIEVVPFHAPLRDAAEIARQITRAADAPDVDAVVIARGGGSPTDLHQFNTPVVLEAVAAAARKRFVLTAIGHADDSTYADQLASRHEPVPAAAGAWLRKQEVRIYFERKQTPPAAVVNQAMPTGGGEYASVPSDAVRVGARPLATRNARRSVWLRALTVWAVLVAGGVAAVWLIGREVLPTEPRRIAPERGGQFGRPAAVPAPAKAMEPARSSKRSARKKAAGSPERPVPAAP